METKKLKKLILKKDVISRLENFEMRYIKGGYEGAETCWCLTGTLSASKEVSCAHCNEDFSTPAICPNYSQAEIVGGCNAETCGWGYTCNGR